MERPIRAYGFLYCLVPSILASFLPAGIPNMRLWLEQRKRTIGAPASLPVSAPPQRIQWEPTGSGTPECIQKHVTPYDKEPPPRCKGRCRQRGLCPKGRYISRSPFRDTPARIDVSSRRCTPWRRSARRQCSTSRCRRCPGAGKTTSSCPHRCSTESARAPRPAPPTTPRRPCPRTGCTGPSTCRRPYPHAVFILLGCS